MKLTLKRATTNTQFTPALVLTLFLGIGFVTHATAGFNFKDKLKDAVKNQIDPNASNKPEEAVSSEASENAKPNPLSQINWQNPSTAEEIAIGREITGNLLGASPLVKDADLQQYVNNVGRWVASNSERADLPWRFGVIESEAVNAFAAPGGYIVITKGLYRKMTNEAQLAGVLGHEIAHVVAKHQLKVIQKQQLVNAGANLLSSKLAKKNAIANKVIGSGAEISARSLDKNAEYEADRLGVSYATRSGYSAYGLVDVLQELALSSSNDGSIALLFKTHPHPDERLSLLGDAIGSKFDHMPEGKTLENRFYQLKNNVVNKISKVKNGYQ